MENQNKSNSNFHEIFLSFTTIENEDGNEYIVPFSCYCYPHFPFLPSETDTFIHFLEEYKKNFKDDYVLNYNEYQREHVYDKYDYEYSSNYIKKTDDQFLDEYFNFDDFDCEEYNLYLEQYKNISNDNVYDVNAILKEGLNTDVEYYDKTFVIVFFKNKNIEKIVYSTNVLAYIGAHKDYGDSIYIKPVPEKYIADLVFELKYIYGLLLNSNVKTVAMPRCVNYKFSSLANAKKAYKLKYGISNRSDIWKNAEIYAHLNVANDNLKKIIVKPELDAMIKSKLQK